MKKLFTFLGMVFCFFTLFGANQTVSTRPYNPDLAWNKNLLEDLSNATVYVHYGSIVQDGNRLGLVRDRDTSDYARLEISINQHIFGETSLENVNLDFEHANAYVYASESKINVADTSIKHQEGCLNVTYWKLSFGDSFRYKKYPTNSGAIEKPEQGASIVHYSLVFQNESLTDTLWISDLEFKLTPGSTFELTENDVIFNPEYGSVEYTTGTYYEGESAYLYAIPSTGYYFDRWSGLNSTSYESAVLYEKPAKPLEAIFKAYKGHITVLRANKNEDLWVWSSNGFFKDSARLSVKFGLSCYDIEWSDGYIGNERYWSKSGYDTLYVKLINHEPTHTLKANDDNMGYVFGINEYYTYYYEPNDSNSYKTDTIRGSFRRESSHDSIINLYAKPYPGYRLSHWEDGSTYTTRYIGNSDISCDSSHSYIAYFEKIDTFNIVVLSADTTMGTVSGSGIYISGEEIAKKATPKDGYTLDKWVSLSGNNLNNALGNDTIIAYFRKEVYYAHTSAYYLNNYGWHDSIKTPNLVHIINISTGDADSSANSYIKSSYGDTLIITAREDDEHFFVRWTDGNTSNPRTIICKNDNYLEALYSSVANFDTIYIDVIANNYNWGSVSGSGWYAKGDSMHIKAIPADGYLFSHWKSVNGLSIDFAQGNDTIFAYFVKDSTNDTIPFVEPVDSFFINVIANNYNWGSVSGSGWYAKGDSMHIKAIPADGYLFSHWKSVNGLSIDFAQGNDTIFAYFVKDSTNDTIPFVEPVDSFFINVIANNYNWGSVSGSGWYAKGDSMHIKAIPADGYLFSHWKSVNGLSIDFAQGNDTIFAYFVKDSTNDTIPFVEPVDSFYINVIANNYNWGSVSGSGWYAKGDSMHIKAIPADGYLFSHWKSVNGLSIDFAQGNDTIFAYFVKDSTNDTIPFVEPVDSFYINVIANNYNWGSVSGSGWYAKGDSMHIKAIPADGYLFSHWESVNGLSIDFAQGNDTIFAYFVKDSTNDTIPVIEPIADSVYFDVRANNIALGSVIGNGWYSKGDTVTIEAIANENAVFEKWSDGVTASKRQVICYNDSLIAIFNKVAEQTENLVEEGEWEKDSTTSDVLTVFMTIDLTKLPYTAEQKKHLTIQASIDIIKAKGCNATIECYADATMTKCLGTIVLKAGLNGISGLIKYTPKPSLGGTFSESCELPENTNFLKFVLEDEEAESFTEIKDNFQNMELALSRKSYELELASSNDSYGTVYGEGEYLGGDTAVVKAVAAPGYTFVRWSDNEVNPEREIVMSEALSLTAIFDEATNVEDVVDSADALVNVYTIEGYTLKRNVKLSEALKGLGKGFYIVNSKKVRIQQ